MWIEESRALRRATGRQGCVRRLRGQSKGPKGSGWDRAIHRRVKRYGSIHGVPQVRGKNLDIEHSEAAAAGGFGIPEGIPGEAEPGLKVITRSIREHGL